MKIDVFSCEYNKIGTLIGTPAKYEACKAA